MTLACDPCLRRAHLIAELAPWIAGLLDRPRARKSGLLALPDGQLLAAAAAGERERAERFLATFDADRARRQAESAGVVPVCRHDPAYPPASLSLSDPPAVLFVAAESDGARALAALDPAVTLVGTRRPSPYGLEMASALGRGLAAAGIPVVSGLALGIDAACHRGCLAGGGLPVAVLAGGCDRATPRANAHLYEQVRRQGMVLSEMPPGCPAFRWSFPARNRIMAALGRMTVLVEARSPSGSLITSHFAQDLGRTVGAVPGRATAEAAAGVNALIGDGARVVTGAQDVLDELYGVGARTLPAEPVPLPENRIDRRVLEAVASEATPGALARAAGLSAAEARASLGRLEAGGHVRRGPLGLYERVPAPAAGGGLS